MDKILSSLILLALIPSAALAQIIPDRTLGAENSVVESNGNRDTINGGAIRDANLFHSFQEFNVEVGKEAYFANPDGITNIFSRVTGNNFSDIQGVLGVLGNANLFFLNPNGIIFGENASLDVGGSFVASTANAIQFGDRGWFSATDPEQPPLLTVQPSAFFFNQIKAGRIENRSTAPAGVDLLERPVFGLRVPDGQSLLLLGGDIAFNGGRLHALGGQLELAGVTGDGIVELNVDGNNLSLTFPEDIARTDILLTNEAFVNTSGSGGGAIAVWGRQVKLSDGSQIAATTLGSKAGRGLTVNASESVELAGTTDNKLLSSGLFTQTGGTGDAGDLTIITKHLRVENGARVLAGTFSQGNAGNLTVNASESVQMNGATGFTPFGPSFSSRMGSDTGRFFGSRLRLNPLIAQTQATGTGGKVTIITRQLQLFGGGQIGVDTRGSRDGGSLTVNASESVQVIGFDPIDGTVSGLSVQAEGTGDAGDLSITTGQLLIKDGAQVGSGTFGEGEGGTLTVNASESVQLLGRTADGTVSGLSVQAEGTGDAGDLSITTGQLLIKDGAFVSAGTFSEGEGGTLTVNASESVQLLGRTADGQLPSGLFTQARGAGNAGDLSITTGQLLIQDGAFVSARSLESGSSAGNLEINANSILLNNQGIITAETTGGREGNITMQIADNLILTDNSTISALALGDANGGNIDINAGFIQQFSF